MCPAPIPALGLGRSIRSAMCWALDRLWLRSRGFSSHLNNVDKRKDEGKPAINPFGNCGQCPSPAGANAVLRWADALAVGGANLVSPFYTNLSLIASGQLANKRRSCWEGNIGERSTRNGDGRSPPHCPSTCTARTSVGCKENLLSQRLCFQSGVAWRFCPVKMWNFVSFCTREKQPV